MKYLLHLPYGRLWRYWCECGPQLGGTVKCFHTMHSVSAGEMGKEASPRARAGFIDQTLVFATVSEDVPESWDIF